MAVIKRRGAGISPGYFDRKIEEKSLPHLQLVVLFIYCRTLTSTLNLYWLPVTSFCAC